MAVSDDLKDAERIVDVWDANPTLTVGIGDKAITKDDVKTDIADITDMDAHIAEVRTMLTGLIRQRRNRKKGLDDKVTRTRSGIRGAFGPDSPEYSQAGGTRTSERKPRTVKPKTP